MSSKAQSGDGWEGWALFRMTDHRGVKQMGRTSGLL